MSNMSDPEQLRAKEELLQRMRAHGVEVVDYKFHFVRAWDADRKEAVLRLDAYPKDRALA